MNKDELKNQLALFESAFGYWSKIIGIELESPQESKARKDMLQTLSNLIQSIQSIESNLSQ
jgi:hypothetical protein